MFFGAEHGELIQLLDRQTKVFRLPLVTIMANVNVSDVSLRLDSNIVRVEENAGSDGYQLRETYSIKRGPKISNVYGKWSKNQGLSVPTTNVYDRRKNLGGVVLRDAILQYTKITQPIIDNNGSVIDSKGVFQGH